MFDGWIDMGLLAQAFNLSDVECIELAKHVPYKFCPESLYQGDGLEEIDRHAEEYAQELMNNPDQRAAYCVCHDAMNAHHGDTQQVNTAWDTLYKAPRERGAAEEAFAFLRGMTRRYFIMDLRVKRDNAVSFLVKKGYPFQKEVKGLSRAIVDSILMVKDSDENLALMANAPADGNTNQHVILVPSSLWKGKTEQSVRDAMRQESFEDSVIAYVLHKWCGLKNKTQIGKLLAKPEKEDSTYLRLAKRLLAKASNMNIQNAC